ncbi:DEAD/DEAH box helicase [Thauera sinica]|uniref:ATP-dependent RNA helicase DeaD n=1 Tax=Thauera sinica TaxID=2665146 RepID=A0ABW1AQ58_9RHOO|nr:DEAD/DEAH box helicase [Thauera sp. K11]ATE59573.1 ATP-dependent RNA helicase [Thauera sp. K11]
MTESTIRFADLGLPEPILTALTEVGYETPSPIQAACIPELLAGRDLLGEAQTGTGKTAAFALPMLARLDLSDARPQVLVLTPTRELAIQVSEAFAKYAHHLKGFHVLPIYGGQSMVVQLRQLSRGAQVVVGTPGRIMDHLERGSLKLDALKSIVLDEADEMLRMGFIDDVEWILEHTPATRQTALFSATMPNAIRDVAHRHLREPREVKIRAATATVAKISQRYWLVRGVDKLDALTRILDAEESFDAAIVFVRTKIATEELADKLAARGYAAAALNGDMTQGLRERVIEQLKNGSLDIVIATDVAARGIDVPRVSHVINYDIPYDTEAYVHRIGRTGRAGREGAAILFVAPRETRMLKMIERATRQPITPIALPSSEEVSNLRVAQFKRLVVDTVGGQDLGFFMDVVNGLVEENEIDIHEVAAALAYLAQRDRPLQIEESGRGWELATTPTHNGGRPPRDEAFTTGIARERPQRPNRDEILQRRRAFADGALVRYRIEVGRNQGASPKEIVGAIANEGGIEGKYIGQIHLFNDFSTVELPANLPADLLDTLRRTRVRQMPLNIRPLTDAEATAMPERRRPSRDDEPRRGYGDEGRSPRSYGEAGRTGWVERGAGHARPGGYGKPGAPRRDERKPYPGTHEDRGGKAPFSTHKPRRHRGE